MRFELEKLVRPNVARLLPYASARSESGGDAEVYLDANENAFGSPAGMGLNRYPDPLQKELKSRLSAMFSISADQIFVGNGSDEPIDLVLRVFCEPGRDECIICPPTYGMYSVLAELNDVGVWSVPLTEGFQLDVNCVLDAVSEKTKLIFICSPNNPTGNLMDRDGVVRIANEFSGIVVVDEAYIEFSSSGTIAEELGQLPNLVVLRTFSKAWGMAGLRVGMALAAGPIIELMNKVKPPYNISGLVQQRILEVLDRRSEVDRWISQTLTERERLGSMLAALSCVLEVFPSDANFLLVKVNDAKGVYRSLLEEKIVVRDRSSVELCGGCLRITVGTAEENDRLVDALARIAPQELTDELFPLIIGGQ